MLNRYIVTYNITITGFLKIERSKARSWAMDENSNDLLANKHSHVKAYDGDYTTFYSVKDGDANQNRLQLFLSRKYGIGTVKLTNRVKGCCHSRIVGTEVMVYSSNEAQIYERVAKCGKKITGKCFLWYFSVGAS